VTFPETSFEDMERSRYSIIGSHGTSVQINTFSPTFAISWQLATRKSSGAFLCENMVKKSLERNIVIVVTFDENCI